MHTYMHTYIHTYIHTYMNTRAFERFQSEEETVHRFMPEGYDVAALDKQIKRIVKVRDMVGMYVYIYICFC